jgi:hypothetical protein
MALGAGLLEGAGGKAHPEDLWVTTFAARGHQAQPEPPLQQLKH